MNQKIFFMLNLTILLAVVLFMDPAFCGITDAQIKAASKTFTDTMKDWMPAIIGGGLMGSGICLFANNFKMGIAGLAGTGFLYAAKSFVGDGQAALVDAAVQLLGLIP
ncbi:MAG: hypothetical protein IJ730_00400 [Alphaproteobacteria bacterium]|nr:hypothetical protein [Alphaproteobacteria bacterium]